MGKRAFTTSDIAGICHHSRNTVKRWLEKGTIKGYRVGISGHWRILPRDLALFLKNNNIPFPDPTEIGIDLNPLTNIKTLPTFCWEFYKDTMNEHVRPDKGCDDCLVYKVKSINCYSFREEMGHKKIHCYHSCEDCAYFHFQQKEMAQSIMDASKPYRGSI
jgi:hypothetical protein